MKIMFLQELTGGLLNGLLKPRFKGLFARTPTVAVLLLTAVVAACANGDGGGAPTPGGSTPPTPPTMITADCVFAEDVGGAIGGTKSCKFLALPQMFDSNTTYNITVGKETTIGFGELGLGNFNFTQIINGNVSDPKVVTRTNNQIELSENATAVNITISGIADNVFGEFYIELVLVDNDEAAVKVRYTISITPMNDDPVFNPTSYDFDDIPFNSPAGYSVGSVSASDIDGDTVRYSIIGGTDDTDLFQISSTGEITLKKVAVNSEDSAITYTFNVTASDDQGGSARIVITVSVLPFFRADCIFAEDEGTKDCGLLALPQVFNSNTTYNITFGEVNKGNTSKIGPGNFNFTQIIQGDTLNHPVVNFNQTQKQLTLSENATAVNITIIDITPNLFGEFYIELVKSDNATVKIRYTISITPVNDDPVFTAPPGNFADIPFNSPAGYSVGNVSVTDIDNDTITYSIIGGDDDIALFQINPTTGESATGSARGEIILKAIADTAGEYSFNVTANDGNGGSVMAEIAVSVLPDIDITPPVFTRTPYSFDLSLSAANAADVLVYNVEAEGAEGTDFVYSLTGGSDLFKLADDENTNGSINIFLSRAATLSDFAASSIIFQVVATHTIGGLSSEEDITVNLINDLSLDDDFDGDGVKGFYDAFPHDATMNVTGNGEPNDPYNITNIYQLQAIAGVDHTGMPLGSSDFTGNSFLYGTNAAEQLTKHYKLANDINASATADTTVWAKPAVTTYIGRGWTPIAGESGQSFSGSFNGEGYAIRNLNMILRAAAFTDTFGLFGTSRGNISAVGLENIEMRIQAQNNNWPFAPEQGNGGLVGENEVGGIIQYAYVSGLVNATAEKVGGLVGSNEGEISYSYSTAAVEGRLDTGGLVGSNTAGGRVSSSYATGDASGAYGVRADDNTLYGYVVGALVGYIDGNTGNILKASYATGGVTGDTTRTDNSHRGSLVGQLQAGAMIASSYWNNNPGIMGIGDGAVTGHTGLTTAQLQGCGLNGEVISSAPPAPDCTGLFPSDDWDDDIDSTPDITRGWVFRANEYPSLSAVRSSDNKEFFPSAVDQECQRNGMPLGCE